MAGLRRVHVPVAGPPGSYAWFTQPGALSGFEAVRGKDSLWNNEFLPLKFAKLTYRPFRVAHRVLCPLFVTIGEQDDVVSRNAAERTVKRAPRGECDVYPIDHFGGFLGKNFDRVVADQIEFLSRHLLTVQTPAPRAIS